MEITVDIEDTVPLYAQLVTQIKQAVMGGAIAPGDPLPSIRQLANDLEMNNKTVAKAYQLLERDRVIQTKGYRGTYIHPDARVNSMVDVNDLVVTTLTKVIKNLRDAGATDSEIRIAFGNILNNKTA